MYHINEKSVLVARPGQRKAISLVRKASLSPPRYVVHRCVLWIGMLLGLDILIIEYNLNLVMGFLLAFLVGLLVPYSVRIFQLAWKYRLGFALATEKERGNLLMLPAGSLAILRERFGLPDGRRTTETLCWQVANNFDLFAELQPAFETYLASQDDETRQARRQELWTQLDRLPQLGLD